MSEFVFTARESGASLDSRPALPAGDALSWAILVHGTMLEGVPWPDRGCSGWDAPHLADALRIDGVEP